MSKKVKIKNFVGGHDVVVYADCEYDKRMRKYRVTEKSRIVAKIKYCGWTLNAYSERFPESELNGIPIGHAPQFRDVDPVPEGCDFAIVSTVYVAACKALGVDTSNLLTTGTAVIDDSNKVVGCIQLIRN